ncbi:unnamed protein product [Penicillium roqueforti FM164]|uniref:Genomic scaffold, ProqFM164S01 n=1 Tax=Penicillium roqueforti (strain FM164) TaxID=1365484 RepID=W6PYB6_PENRF|nr:unnamed protein product [Penicillium roqueforti FM164]
MRSMHNINGRHASRMWKPPRAPTSDLDMIHTHPFIVVRLGSINYVHHFMHSNPVRGWLTLALAFSRLRWHLAASLSLWLCFIVHDTSSLGCTLHGICILRSTSDASPGR